jgi:hypothetical protein
MDNGFLLRWVERSGSIRGRAMLESLNDQVRECLRHADDCVQQAASQADPKLRRNYLIIGTCWLKLSYELSDQLANFSKPKNTEPVTIVSPPQTRDSAQAEPPATRSPPN